MEREIRFCTTEDGVRIAYTVIGNGPPLVYMPWYPASLQLDWSVADCARWFERLASYRTLVLFDGRGSGASQSDVSDFGIEAMMSDLSAVADAARFETFDLAGTFHTTPVAIAFAAHYPERVDSLVLWRGYANAADWRDRPTVRALGPIASQDWFTFTEAATASLLGWSEGSRAHEHAPLLRDAISPEVWAVFFRQCQEYDVSRLLMNVRAPTLLVHRRQLAQPSLEIVQGMAAAIPGARLVVCEGESPAVYLGDSCVMDAICAFLEIGGGIGKQRVRAVLFTDLAGHSEMMARLGDECGRTVLREHEEITRSVLKHHGGTEVKTLGDGFMASFESVTRAVECAVALQRAFAARKGEPLSVRVGINAGEPIEEGGDLFGASVILASRIAAKAAGGEILVADTVRGLCSGKGFLFADRGEFVAKGFEEPVRIYEVSWSDRTTA